eukprot:4905017-Pyramimonas_sp.AAC.1
MKINPAYHPRIDDGSERCAVVQGNVMDTAVLAEQGAHARQTVRGILRKRPALTFDSEKGAIWRTSSGQRMFAGRSSSATIN